MNDAAAILTASFLGSWHCAGMCGPLIGFLTHNQTHTLKLEGSYHLGRLLGYMFLTVVFQKFGSAFTSLLNSLGLGLISQWFFFGLIIIWAGLVLAKVKLPFKSSFLPWLKVRNRYIFGFSAGISTAFLPCIWLYGFVIAAGSKPELYQAVLLIISFWLGTLPALLISQKVFRNFSLGMRNFSRVMSMATLILMIGFSLYAHFPKKNQEVQPVCYPSKPTN